MLKELDYQPLKEELRVSKNSKKEFKSFQKHLVYQTGSSEILLLALQNG